MSQVHTLGKAHTKVTRKGDGELRVAYHNTDVVVVHANGNITLDTGGWRTLTTKTRMNQASNQFGLGFQVHQAKGQWFVRMGNWNETPKAVDLAFDERMVSFNPRTGRKTRNAA